MYISNPTWGNHRNIFSDAGLEWKYYRYFNPSTIGLDFEGMKEDISNAPDGSVIVLHGMLLTLRMYLPGNEAQFALLGIPFGAPQVNILT
jgi:hypothetical protein